MPEIYPRWVNHLPLSWGLSLRFIDSRSRNRLVMAVINQMWKRGIQRMVDEHPADVLVSVHSLFNRPAMRALEATQLQRPPFVTVITDLVTTPAFWYERRVERCLVPTQAAYDRGRPGMQQTYADRAARSPAVCRGPVDKATAREKLDGRAQDGRAAHWRRRRMGPVTDCARINRRELISSSHHRRAKSPAPAAAGSIGWQQPSVCPFVTNMPELMAAADILVTKAGPATICEACIMGRRC